MTYKELSEAYMDRCYGNQEPHTLLIRPDLLGKVLEWTGYWARFYAADVEIDPTLTEPFKFLGGRPKTSQFL